MYKIINGTKVITVDANEPETEKVREAAKYIREGDVVAFPTETVYGLGADALSPDAVKKIFIAKGRPQDNPLIVHIAIKDEIERIANGITSDVEALMERFWPGPLTLILEKKDLIPNEITAGLNTVGIRMPSHPVAQKLILESGVPIAAPSANISGRPSPTTALHVIKDLAGKIPIILDGGPTEVGLESTVLDMTSESPVILRPGGVTYEQLCSVLKRVEIDSGLLSDGFVPKSPGMKYTHYSPKAEVILVIGSTEKVKETVRRIAGKETNLGRRVGIMATSETMNAYSIGDILDIGSREDPSTIAANLFSALREFDNRGVDLIIAEGIEEKGIGLAVMNRIKKASGFNIIYADEHSK
ncbi:MAG TPA: threonylcarbamoyl-AMP synthase [Thermoanaerobacterales bacterium]|nr:threonylcarbamoyl-AMP synthase [Thermoanaerobacterales bacterium]